MDSFYVEAFILAVIGFALIAPFFTCRRRAVEEHNLKPIWQEFCSGKMGSFGMNIPALRISLYDKFIVICFFNPNVIPYKKIGNVSVNTRFFSLRVKGVMMKLKGFKSSYYFNSRDPEMLAKLIKDRL
jgi:hypothetical protein